MKNKILIIEDDLDIQEILHNYLYNAGYDLVIASDGIEGLNQFDDSIHLVLLDIMLPKMNGFKVCHKIRESSNVPIIMLTALDDEVNEINGYKQQVDDYISKPFSPKVLLYKIERMLQRHLNHKKEPKYLFYKDIKMDVEGYHVYLKDEEVTLTQREFQILHTLLSNRGIVFTRAMLLDLIWIENEDVEDRVIDSHMKNLRKKLGEDYIKTIRGVGYRLDK